MQHALRTSAPNRLWVADIPYMPTWEGFRSLAGVLDACSRRVVGWTMAQDLRTALVVAAREMAVWQRHRDAGLIYHSDPGCQYPSRVFGERCRAARIRCSMGSVGDGDDHALAASFFATLECELLARHPFHTRHDARTALFAEIEVFNNRQRRHAALD